GALGVFDVTGLVVVRVDGVLGVDVDIRVDSLVGSHEPTLSLIAGVRGREVVKPRRRSDGVWRPELPVVDPIPAQLELQLSELVLIFGLVLGGVLLGLLRDLLPPGDGSVLFVKFTLPVFLDDLPQLCGQSCDTAAADKSDDDLLYIPIHSSALEFRPSDARGS